MSRPGVRQGGVKPAPIEKRFWPKVDQGDPNECWEWQAHRDRTGYGRINVKGRAVLAHRVSWEIEHGSIPAGLCVCHRCDNPPCVNPRHLFLGTQADNTADMASKSRARNGFGEIVAPDIVRAAVDDYLNGNETQVEVAARYGVSRGALSKWLDASTRVLDAGMTPRRKVRPLKPCGTAAAYNRHLKRGEEPCDACRAGNAAKERINKARRRAAA